MERASFDKFEREARQIRAGLRCGFGSFVLAVSCLLYTSIDREQAVPLAENENFIVDLIDMDVYDEEENRLGTLTDVLQTGANDVYVVEADEGKEILLPAIPSCILDVDVEAAKMIVRIPEGLL